MTKSHGGAGFSAMAAEAVALEVDDRRCWICNGPTFELHCKVICKQCGFVRDCNDP